MSRGTLDPASLAPPFAYGAFTLSGRSFQDRSAGPASRVRSPNPGAHRTPVWAPPVPLAATPGITFVFSSSGYLDVSVRRVPLRRLSGHLCPPSAHGYMESVHVGSPIQKSVDPWIFAPPHGFSQLITSFFGSQCLGIRPALFLA